MVSVTEQYPVIAVTGPRQSGKSTLIKAAFPQRDYVNLEAIRDLDFALNDPVGFLNQFQHGCIIDEVQKAPRLLSEIQVRVDKAGTNGMYILSGSENLLLSEAISQSLAGRILSLKLLPLSLGETDAFELEATSLDELLYRGFYPRVYDQNLDPTEAYGAYAETYVERDVRNILNIKDLARFRRFLEIVAGRIGQLLNKDNLANEVGVSSTTIEEWISVLEATFICHRLPPWHANISKRLVKTPKMYFMDVGLACYMLGIQSPAQLRSHPLRGFLFENFQVVEVLKYLYNRNLRNRLYFFRDSHGNEVDMVLQRGNAYLAIECKSSETFQTDFLKGIKSFEKIQSLSRSGIILGSAESQTRSEFDLVGWDQMAPWLDKQMCE